MNARNPGHRRHRSASRFVCCVDGLVPCTFFHRSRPSHARSRLRPAPASTTLTRQPGTARLESRAPILRVKVKAILASVAACLSRKHSPRDHSSQSDSVAENLCDRHVVSAAVAELALAARREKRLQGSRTILVSGAYPHPRAQ